MRQVIDRISNGLRELIPVMVFCVCLVVIVCIPLKVMSYGFIPPDDAMRHAAKAISAKNWDQILVVRPEFKMDSHPGWHAILGAVYRSTGCGQDTLVLFSVVLLFILFAAVPIFFLGYPEAWLATLLAVTVVSPSLIIRLFLGRPYILTMSVILILFFLWPLLREKKRPYAVMGMLSVLIAASTWIHASWYLFALPVACFFIAREVRAGLRLALSAVAGVVIGALLTGHPYLFLKQTVTHAMLAFGNISVQRLLVGEFQSFSGDATMVLLILGALVWRKTRRKDGWSAIHDPIFILAAMGWALGFVAVRFWTDWGMPAAIFWLMSEVTSAFNENMEMTSWRRAFLTLAISAALFLAVSADIGSRWTYNLTTEYLSADDPKQAGWLPEPGGIIYSNDMRIFYQTFYGNPKAPWRYILGFEPAMMPPEDLAILRKIQWNLDAPQAFEPWIDKMRPADRLMIRGVRSAKPDIPGLEWYYAVTGTWIGRKAKEAKN
jgi:hypothetical protein